ncbi:hypothetical protein BOO69_10230 [Sulfitobacter alexandrii]|uniref:Uncharacterized protein n=1 Tax=Sulfitobacter alexandrii TaxID=1917485 RepID=A0A1J0WHG0_9RHOB|nr:hypothetical protein [Sulfitobacter alexandrii]APE43747.1 hypothetical protein BOO69_10230 [Sulfitobacter alexandrii]
MNQIINMIVRQVMHQLVRRGVNAGFDQASKMGKRRRQPELDEDGNPVQQRQLTPEERAARRARRQARLDTGHAKQSMKTLRRFSKF